MLRVIVEDNMLTISGESRGTVSIQPMAVTIPLDGSVGIEQVLSRLSGIGDYSVGGSMESAALESRARMRLRRQRGQQPWESRETSAPIVGSPPSFEQACQGAEDEMIVEGSGH